MLNTYNCVCWCVDVDTLELDATAADDGVLTLAVISVAELVATSMFPSDLIAAGISMLEAGRTNLLDIDCLLGVETSGSSLSCLQKSNLNLPLNPSSEL